MPPDHSFLSACTSGGCGAKIGPGELAGLLTNLPHTPNPRLLVGYDASDDAAVWQLDATTSLISTADFFSPMVEDPKTFGRIAAANALSDVWAMGGKPILALNLVCFPEAMDKSLLAQMLAGGAEKITEAGATLGGGHSVYDKEPKYGLAVTGLVPTAHILRNNTPKPGHCLLLTKPLGVGIILAAARGGLAAPQHLQAAIASMERLNGPAAAHLQNYSVSACTDVTGFGLLAHLMEMTAEKVSVRLYPDALPLLPGARAYADEYLLTAAGQRNRNHFANRANIRALPFALQEILFDPQTSGGLLLTVAPEEATTLLAALQTQDPHAALIGEILPLTNLPVLFA